MKCPECGGSTHVFETRVSRTGDLVRRRQCLEDKFHKSFKTIEVPQVDLIALRLQVFRFNQIKALLSDEIRQPV